MPKAQYLRRRVEQDEAQGERYETPRCQAAEKLHCQKHRQRRRVRRQQGNDRKSDGCADQNSPRTVRGAHPDGRERDEHLGEVCAVVIQAPSSKPAPTAPRMSARPKVESRPFKVEMNVPMSTASSPSQGMEVGGDRQRRRGDARTGAGAAAVIGAAHRGRRPSLRPTCRAAADRLGRPHRRSGS